MNRLDYYVNYYSRYFRLSKFCIPQIENITVKRVDIEAEFRRRRQAAHVFWYLRNLLNLYPVRIITKSRPTP
jgi:hypothetical protein